MAKPKGQRSKRRARRAITRAAEQAARELADMQGGDDDPEPTVANAPPLASFLPSAGGAPAPATERMTKLGPPPSDPLLAQEWLYNLMVASAADAVNDAEISHKDRRRELRAIGASAAALFPDAIRADAVRMIKRDQDELDRRAAQKGGAKMEARPNPVRPGSGGGPVQISSVGGIESPLDIDVDFGGDGSNE